MLEIIGVMLIGGWIGALIYGAFHKEEPKGDADDVLDALMGKYSKKK